MNPKKGKAARPDGVPAYSKEEMKRLLEAVLFATDKPVPASALAQVLSGTKEEAVREALSELGREYEETGRSFILKEVGGGFLLLTHPAYEPWVRKLFRGRLTLRLSKSALETIAIIAYRQPISKAEIETIRGVNADGVLNTLLDRKLIRVVGRKPGMGRALLYGTTADFLTYMGLNDLDELPQMEEMKAILESKEPSPPTAPTGEAEESGEAAVGGNAIGGNAVAEDTGEAAPPDAAATAGSEEAAGTEAPGESAPTPSPESESAAVKEA